MEPKDIISSLAALLGSPANIPKWAKQFADCKNIADKTAYVYQEVSKTAKTLAKGKETLTGKQYGKLVHDVLNSAKVRKTWTKSEVIRVREYYVNEKALPVPSVDNWQGAI